MKTALFIITPYVSHYNACFGLARAFQRRGFRIVFTGSLYLREHILAQGYEFRNIEYTSEYNVRTLKGFIGFLLRSLLDKQVLTQRYRKWYKSVVDIRTIYEYHQPEHTFIDAHLSHYYLFLLKYYSKSITILSTEPSMKRTWGVPPLNSFYIPNTTRHSVMMCEWLWILYVAKSQLRRTKNSTSFFGKSETYFQRRLCKKHQIRWKDVFEVRNTSFIGLKAAPTIVLGSEALEFSHRKTLDNERFLFLPIQRDETAYLTDEYILAREKIQRLKNECDYSVIYCSLGTLGGLNAKQGAKFLQKLTKAIENQERLLLIISTGGLGIGTKTSNIFLLERVPQLDILRYCDMMVTHGGHNSINECLQAGVPMLVYPLNRKTDQPGNATRVYANGYGLFGKMDQDSPEVILSKISDVLRMGRRKKPPDDTPRFAQYFSV